MKIKPKIYIIAGILIFFVLPVLILRAQKTERAEHLEREKVIETKPGRVSIDFKDADIKDVLRVISYKSGMNIISGEDVKGAVTIHLVNVPWQKALDVILKTYGFGYDRDENIISVTTLEKLQERREKEKLAAEVELLISKVFNLKYLDAGDTKKSLEPMLSARGKITIVESTGQKGWEFGAEKTGKRARKEEERIGKSNTLIITDTPSTLERIEVLLEQIDVKPDQILIEAKFIEINKDRLKDLGIDWGTGSAGAESIAITGVAVDKTDGNVVSTLGAHNLGSEKSPSVFGSKAGISGTEPFDTGLEIIYKKLTGTQFEVILHALEEDVHTNTLSAPRIMTLNNQEATILVGTKYPILKETTTEATASSTVKELDYYQDIGIQLNVVPQICVNGYINMIVHPAVTSYTAPGNYPIITAREVETQVLMKDGETIVIGGLLKEIKSEGKFSVPILGKIPLLGLLFQRRTTDIEKIDLLIFITARIVTSAEDSNIRYLPKSEIEMGK